MAGADVLAVAPYACEQIVGDCRSGAAAAGQDRDFRADDLGRSVAGVRRDR